MIFCNILQATADIIILILQADSYILLPVCGYTLAVSDQDILNGISAKNNVVTESSVLVFIAIFGWVRSKNNMVTLMTQEKICKQKLSGRWL